MVNDRKKKNILITGGSGFIGSNFIRYLFEDTDFKGRVINLDKLTYAGNIENLSDVEQKYGKDRYFFENEDICEIENVDLIFDKYIVDTVIHFAAESHVDRSIVKPDEFIKTNILGTFNLLEVARKYWLNNENAKEEFLLHHISTDEVFGSLGEKGYFYENTAYDPRSPYSASKASSDHIVRAYHHTYGLPITLSNCSNNYGPYQFPEKLIPLMILNAIEGESLPIYGDGKNIRDWLFVKDHCSAIWTIINRGKIGETYNIGGNSEKNNIEVVNEICNILDKIKPILNKKNKSYKELISFVKDRPGHDRRYAINFDKIRTELGWKPSVGFHEGLEGTVKWYLNNSDWVNKIKSGEYRDWIKKNYGEVNEK